MFHATEESILARLRSGLPGSDGLPDNIKVLQQSDIDEAKDLRQFAPYVALIYDGFTPLQFIPPGQTQQASLDWYVIVGTTSAKGNGKNIKARDVSGLIALRVLELLLGFHLGGARYLRLRDTPGPEYEGGYAYLPIGFSCPATFKGIP